MKIDEPRLRYLCAKGLNARQIATRLGVTVSAVHQACKRLSIAVVAGERSGSIGCLERNA